nr:SDR family oxidoreductase [Rhodococcus sp. (in: high G+C Gram-positive bacteria)]
MTPTALVTGGAKGIGAATAHALAAGGHTVVVHHRNDAERALAVVSSLPGHGHAIVQGDLGDPEIARDVVAAAVHAVGGIDVLVNNAGVYDEHPPTATTYEDWQAAWKKVFDINVFGAANVSWAVIEHLMHRPQGSDGARIIFIGSRGAYRGEPDAPAYGASKAAVHSLSQSLAVHLAPHGIAVSAVAPGFTRTELTSDMLAGPHAAAIRAQSPFGRTGEASEIASAVAWLATPVATWASGTVIDLNGASHLR